MCECFKCGKTISKGAIQTKDRHYCSAKCFTSVEYEDQHFYRIDFSVIEWFHDEYGSHDSRNYSKSKKAWANNLEDALTEVLQDIRSSDGLFIDSINNIEVLQKNPNKTLKFQRGSEDV